MRFDKNALEFFLKCKIKNIFDTKIASKIVRTYTDSHGLKNLVQEFCSHMIPERFLLMETEPFQLKFQEQSSRFLKIARTGNTTEHTS